MSFEGDNFLRVRVTARLSLHHVRAFYSDDDARGGVDVAAARSQHSISGLRLRSHELMDLKEGKRNEAECDNWRSG